MATVFLDLDGTLTDPLLGVGLSVIHALEKLGLPAPELDELGWVIGPALIDSFARLGAKDPEQALAFYRERYTTKGLFENDLYDGIPAALKALKDAGHVLHLATAKPHAYAVKVTAHFGLSRYLDHEFGPELDGTRNDKGELLAHALGILGHDAQNCVMVGDRRYDYAAAKAVGMPAVGVTWGYGNATERMAAQAICETPTGLLQAVTNALNA